jgi:hypothetical protein
MCKKCTELADKIDNYRVLASRIQPILDGIKELIARTQAQKDALHPEQIAKAASVGDLFH